MKDLINNPERPEGLTETQERLALSLFNSGIFLFDFDNGFRLRHHGRYPDAPLSPFYINLRLLQSHPETAKKEAVSALIEQSDGLEFKRIAAVPRAADILVSSIADRTGWSQITPRMEKKTHGLEVIIDGVYEPGDTALVVDDLITTSVSKLETIEALENNGLIVRDVVVVFDREQGGAGELAEKGYALHAALRIRPVLNFYRRMGKITQEQLSRASVYLENPLG